MFKLKNENVVIKEEDFIVNPKYNFSINPYKDLPKSFKLSDLQYVVIYANYNGDKESFKKLGINKKIFKRDIDLSSIITIPLYINKYGVFDLRLNQFLPDILYMEKLVNSYLLNINGNIDFTSTYQIFNYKALKELMGKNEGKLKCADKLIEIMTENGPQVNDDIYKFAVLCDEVLMKSMHNLKNENVKNNSDNGCER